MTDSDFTLFERYLLGELSLEEKAELARRLDSDLAFQTAFVNYVEDSQELAELSRGAGETAASIPSRRLPITPGQKRRRFSWLAAAALVALLAVGSWALVRQFDAERIVKPSTVGRLVASSGGDFVRNDQVLHAGDLVPLGRCDLEKGIAKVVFDNGASVTLTGPAEVEFVDISSLKVFRGKITGEAPGEGIRLKVTTPDLEVIDLGTRFGLEIDPAGATEVHVLEGTVQIADRNGDRRILQEGNAAIRAPGEDQSLRPTTIDPARFNIATPPPLPSKPTAWIHYSFDGSDADWLEDSGSGFPGGPFPLSEDFPPEGLTQLNGRFGKAAVIQQPIDRPKALQSTFPGIGDNQPRTIALWINVADQDRDMALAGWGHRAKGTSWQVGLDWKKHSDRLLLRTSFGKGYVVGSTNLADGAWHHVACVYLGGHHGSVAQRIRLYIDGRLEESITVKKGESRERVPESGDTGFVIGHRFLKSSFVGLMDEVFVFDRALGPDEIRNLFESNRIAPRG